MKTDPHCPLCNQRGFSTLCPSCVREYTDTVAAMPELFADLEVTLLRQSRITPQQERASSGRPLVMNVPAYETRLLLKQALANAAACTILSPSMPDLLTELYEVANKASAITDLAPDRALLGNCPQCHKLQYLTLTPKRYPIRHATRKWPQKDGVAAPGNDSSVLDLNVTHVCTNTVVVKDEETEKSEVRVCGFERSVSLARQKTLLEISGKDVPYTDLPRLLSYLGVPCSASQLRNWVYHKKLIHIGYRDRTKLYRMSHVIELAVIAEAKRARNLTKRSQKALT